MIQKLNARLLVFWTISEKPTRKQLFQSLLCSHSYNSNLNHGPSWFCLHFARALREHPLASVCPWHNTTFVYCSFHQVTLLRPQSHPGHHLAPLTLGSGYRVETQLRIFPPQIILPCQISLRSVWQFGFLQQTSTSTSTRTPTPTPTHPHTHIQLYALDFGVFVQIRADIK